MDTTMPNQIRSRLEAEKKRIQDELSQLNIDNSHLMDERGERSHFGIGEEATESTEQEKRMSLKNRLNSLLREVERALQKMDDGSYGICDICQSPIDPARMEALPEAILCMNCRLKEK
jgi:DnaK suppressor protein